MSDMVSELYRVMDVFVDLTVHQAVGGYPNTGDLVKVLDFCDVGHSFYAESNGGNYSAFFKDSQLWQIDDFLQLRERKSAGQGEGSDPAGDRQAWGRLFPERNAFQTC